MKIMKITNIITRRLNAVYYVVNDKFECLHSFGNRLDHISYLFEMGFIKATPCYMNGAGNLTNFIEGCNVQGYTYEIICEGFNNEKELKQMFPEIFY